MRLTKAWRNYARENTTKFGTFWFHPGLSAQTNHVSTFMERQGEDMNAMTWVAHLFYITQGFLIDYEGSDNALADYFADMDGKSPEDAWVIRGHPLMTYDLYEIVNSAFLATRDTSMKADDIPKTDEETEKKEKA